MNNANILSHTIFPESIIKAFCDKNDPVIFLEANEGKVQVSKDTPKTFFAKQGWFTKQNEERLSKDYESNLHNAFYPLIKQIKGKITVPIIASSSAALICKTFAYQQLRDPANTAHVLRQAGAINPPDHIQELQNHLIADEHESSFLSNKLEDTFTPVLWLNYSNTKFLAINTPIEKVYPDGTLRFFVLSPHLAIGLRSKESLKSTTPKSLEQVFMTQDSCHIVHEINSLLVAHAITYEPHIVLGKDPFYLEEVWGNTKKRLTTL